jgi:hypothetical protein
MTGPIQILVLGLEEPSLSVDVLAELEALRQSQNVRLLDVLLVTRARDGTLETLPVPDTAPPGMGELAVRLLGSPDTDCMGAEEALTGATWSLADAIPVGAAAAVAVIEHQWASPLREALHRAGGTALEEAWLAAEDVQRLESLIAEGDS